MRFLICVNPDSRELRRFARDGLKESSCSPDTEDHPQRQRLEDRGGWLIMEGSDDSKIILNSSELEKFGDELNDMWSDDDGEEKSNEKEEGDAKKTNTSSLSKKLKDAKILASLKSMLSTKPADLHLGDDEDDAHVDPNIVRVVDKSETLLTAPDIVTGKTSHPSLSKATMGVGAASTAKSKLLAAKVTRKLKYTSAATKQDDRLLNPLNLDVSQASLKAEYQDVSRAPTEVACITPVSMNDKDSVTSTESLQQQQQQQQLPLIMKASLPLTDYFVTKPSVHKQQRKDEMPVGTGERKMKPKGQPQQQQQHSQNRQRNDDDDDDDDRGSGHGANRKEDPPAAGSERLQQQAREEAEGDEEKEVEDRESHQRATPAPQSSTTTPGKTSIPDLQSLAASPLPAGVGEEKKKGQGDESGAGRDGEEEDEKAGKDSNVVVDGKKALDDLEALASAPFPPVEEEGRGNVNRGQDANDDSEELKNSSLRDGARPESGTGKQNLHHSGQRRELQERESRSKRPLSSTAAAAAASAASTGSPPHNSPSSSSGVAAEPRSSRHHRKDTDPFLSEDTMSAAALLRNHLSPGL
eukprot:jgi/Bigna1/84495/fgenesh1_pg.142_\